MLKTKIFFWMILADKLSQSKVISLAMWCALLPTMLLGCSMSEAPEIEAVTGLSMGTSYTVKWFQNSNQINETDIVDKKQNHQSIEQGVALELIRVERSMSTYMDSSDLNGFNGALVNTWYPVPLEMATLVSKAIALGEKTKGAFDITVGPIVDLWGFGPDPVPEYIPTNAQLELLRPLIGFQNLTVRQEPPALRKSAQSHIDLSAIAKGYGVDAVSNWLDAKGIDNYLVEVGGELRAKGFKPDGTPWRIAIETPTIDAGQIYQIVNVSNMAVATSGNYRNYYELEGVRYSHTLDPKTLMPVTHNLASVTVLDESAADADAMATALMVMGHEEGVKWASMHQVPAYFIIKESTGFVAQDTANFMDYLEN